MGAKQDGQTPGFAFSSRGLLALALLTALRQGAGLYNGVAVVLLHRRGKIYGGRDVAPPAKATVRGSCAKVPAAVRCALRV